MADIRQVTEDFAVAPQLESTDFADIAAKGYRLVISNRPDGETPGQMSAAEAEAAAEAAGLAFVHVPFAGAPPQGAVEAMSRALAENPGPALAFCRSGTRSITAWALGQAASRGMDADTLVARAAAAGYDLAPLKSLFQNLSSR